MRKPVQKHAVIPAKAGIQFSFRAEALGPELDSRLRGNDDAAAAPKVITGARRPF
jgi:hypothetical protein